MVATLLERIAMSEPNVLGIMWWDNEEDGLRHYRCQGVGPIYKHFYKEWVPKSSYRCTSIDWPWDFFVFDNPKDHDRLIQDFPNCVSEDN